jgi:hypothetical protein
MLPGARNPVVVLNHRRIVGQKSARGCVADVRFQQDHAVGRRHSGQRIGARGELIGVLAHTHAVLGDGLVVRHDRSATAVGDKHHLVDIRLAVHPVHGRFEVERDVIPDDVIALAGADHPIVHAQNRKSALGHLAARRNVEIAVVRVHHDERNRQTVGRVAGHGPFGQHAWTDFDHLLSNVVVRVATGRGCLSRDDQRGCGRTDEQCKRCDECRDVPSVKVAHGSPAM